MSTESHLGASLGSSVPLPTSKEVVPYTRFSGSLAAMNFNAVPCKKKEMGSTKPGIDACIATDQLNF